MARQAQKTAVARTDDQPQAVTIFRRELASMQEQFAPTLPAHIPVERFARVVMNAVQRTPRLLMCDRASLWNAAMQSAEDGLLPDKREGAIVPFKKGKDDDGGSPGGAGDYVAVWIPMVLGIRKLVRNSGLIRDLNVQLVYVDEYEAGAFQHELGDTPQLKHRRLPYDGDPAQRQVYCGYSLAWSKDGFLHVPEVMFENEIMAVARRSKSFKAGPWSDPLFALEMRKKTVTKRHFKQLPTDRDLDRVLRRDDALYGFEDGAQRRTERPTIIGGTKAALEHFAGSGRQQSERPTTASRTAVETPPADGDEDAGEHRNATGAAASTEGAANRPKPKTPDEYGAHFEAWLPGMKTVEEARRRWKDEQDLRLELEPKVERDRLSAWKEALEAKFRSNLDRQIREIKRRDMDDSNAVR